MKWLGGREEREKAMSGSCHPVRNWESHEKNGTIFTTGTGSASERRTSDARDPIPRPLGRMRLSLPFAEIMGRI